MKTTPKQPLVLPDPSYVIDRDVTKVGLVTGHRPCRLTGCGAPALCVLWPGGRRTYPCTEGMETLASRGTGTYWKIL